MLEALAEEGPEEALSAETKLLFVCISIGLVIMAGLMSGLTIGLMAMDDMEMEVRHGAVNSRTVMEAPFTFQCSTLRG